MPLIHLAAALLAAQPPVPPDQAALAQCLGDFVAAQRQAASSGEDFTNALANACLAEERAYRSAFVAAAAARGTAFLDADSEAYARALDLRIAQRTAYFAATTGCRQPAGRTRRPVTSAAGDKRSAGCMRKR